jgi:hypothetical protein
VIDIGFMPGHAQAVISPFFPDPEMIRPHPNESYVWSAFARLIATNPKALADVSLSQTKKTPDGRGRRWGQYLPGARVWGMRPASSFR